MTKTKDNSKIATTAIKERTTDTCQDGSISSEEKPILPVDIQVKSCLKPKSDTCYFGKELLIKKIENQKHKCAKCGKSFKTLTDNQLCGRCSKQSVKTVQKKYRSTTGTSETDFKCLHCNKAFARIQGLRRHLENGACKKLPEAKPEWACHKCGKRFSRKDNCSRHMRLYRCTEIPTKNNRKVTTNSQGNIEMDTEDIDMTVTKDNSVIAAARIKKEKATDIYQDGSVSSKETQRAHFDSQLKSTLNQRSDRYHSVKKLLFKKIKNKIHKCVKCGKRYKTLLQNHCCKQCIKQAKYKRIRSITGTSDPDFKCTHCGNAFARIQGLRRHLENGACEYLPKPEQEWACSKCGKRFSRKDNCNRHIRSCKCTKLSDKIAIGFQVDIEKNTEGSDRTETNDNSEIAIAAIKEEKATEFHQDRSVSSKETQNTEDSDRTEANVNSEIAIAAMKEEKATEFHQDGSVSSKETQRANTDSQLKFTLNQRSDKCPPIKELLLDKINENHKQCTKQAPYKHSQYSTGTSDFRCKHCGKAFARIQGLRRHLENGACEYLPKPEQEWACTKCAKRFSRKDNCNRHMRSCNNIRTSDRKVTMSSLVDIEQNTEDSDMIQTLDNSEILIAAIKAEKTTDTYQDGSDSSKETQRANTDSHLKSTLNQKVKELLFDKINKNHKCAECGKSFTTLLQNHCCKQCTKHAKYKRNRSITGTSESDFKCTHCGNAFARIQGLRRHLENEACQYLPNHEREWSCCKCGKCFSRKDNCSRHMRNCKCTNICDKKITMDSQGDIEKNTGDNDITEIKGNTETVTAEIKEKTAGCNQDGSELSEEPEHLSKAIELECACCSKTFKSMSWSLCCDKCLDELQSRNGTSTANRLSYSSEESQDFCFDVDKEDTSTCGNSKSTAQDDNKNCNIQIENNDIGNSGSQLEDCDIFVKYSRAKNDNCVHSNTGQDQIELMDIMKEEPIDLPMLLPVDSCRTNEPVPSKPLVWHQSHLTDGKVDINQTKFPGEVNLYSLDCVDKTPCSHETEMPHKNTNTVTVSNDIESGELIQLRVYKCKHCKKTFHSKLERYIHFKKVHFKQSNLKGQPCLKCKVCSLEFNSRHDLQTHCYNTHLSVPDRSRTIHKCEICGMSHTKSQPWIKPTAKRLICDECGISFTRSCHLKKHITVVHVNARPYKCEICKKRFNSKYYLDNIHVRIHTSDKPYMCDICGKTFATDCSLSNHKKYHFEKTFKCNVCDKMFFTKHSLNIHLVVHTGARLFKCKICQKDFKNESSLPKHMLKHKGK